MVAVLSSSGADDQTAAEVPFTPAGTVAATNVQAAIEEVSGDVGSQAAVDYLVGTAQAGLSAEIVVGTSPGGELGGTWASPTVDASHSGSTHAAVQAASEATAAGALASHVAAADPHIGYRLESAQIVSADIQDATIARADLSATVSAPDFLFLTRYVCKR